MLRSSHENEIVKQVQERITLKRSKEDLISDRERRRADLAYAFSDEGMKVSGGIHSCILSLDSFHTESSSHWLLQTVDSPHRLMLTKASPHWLLHTGISSVLGTTLDHGTSGFVLKDCALSVCEHDAYVYS
jgi:hypothetical protein